MTDPAQACGTDMFALFLLENGWASMGYTLSYHPEWLRETTFPCYERVGGVWRMKAEVEREIDEWLAECKRRRKAIATWTRK